VGNYFETFYYYLPTETKVLTPPFNIMMTMVLKSIW